MEYYSAIKGTNCIICRDMDRPVIQTEVREKRLLYINACMWKSRKMV